ncbi:MAG: DNA-binding response regulator [Gloeocapsa sp. DLM2.Bin57]|nr:MAG: DNA-binding response regulator [Gloeocapsa sp. DLM2.Bin57]
MRILLLEDEPNLGNLIQKGLTQYNYIIDVVNNWEQGWRYGCTYHYDLVILPYSLPKIDGLSLCQRFRENNYHFLILVLLSRCTSHDKISALDRGADGYLCKPLNIDELAAHIRALSRRLNSNCLSVLNWGGLRLNTSNCEVSFQGKSISLTAKEYGLLELFLRYKYEVLDIETIIESLWSSVEEPAEATIRSHIRHLRRKLKLTGLPDDLIITLKGRGYCLKSFPPHG